MGIPKWYGWLVNNPTFKNVIFHQRPDDVDVFAIDVNSLIHNNAQKQMKLAQERLVGMTITQGTIYQMRYEIFRGVFQDIIGLSRTIRSKTTLIVAVDGVAPQAKILQQRSRRYKSATERKPTQIFDTNSITPGTDFMRELDAFIKGEFERIIKLDSEPGQTRDPYAEALPPHIIYSSHMNPGEGEHKISDQLRTMTAQGRKVVVHGMDSDLMMIYLMQLENGWENIYMFRENDVNYGVKDIIDLNLFSRIIREMYKGVSSPVDDFVTIMFLLGNDFLPHFAVFERVDDAITTLIGGYTEFLTTNPGLGITTGSNIHWENFQKFLQFITDRYNNFLLKRWAEIGPGGQGNFRSLIAEKCIAQTTQILGTQIQCIREFDVSRFNKEWYVYAFSPKTGVGRIEPTPEDIKEMVDKYLEGIVWVYGYYKNGAENVNVGWYYPYPYTPLFSDLSSIIQEAFTEGVGTPWEVNPLHFHSDFLSPLEQIVQVLPPASLTSVPEAIRPLYSETSPIYDLMPESFVTDKQGKMEEWQAVAILPIPTQIRVILAVASLNLPPQVLAQYTAQENMVLNRNVEATFRAQPRLRGRGRGRGRGTPSYVRGQYSGPPRGQFRGRGQYSCPPRGERERGRGSARGSATGLL